MYARLTQMIQNRKRLTERTKIRVLLSYHNGRKIVTLLHHFPRIGKIQQIN